MSELHTPATHGLKRFTIRICTGSETALQTCTARTQAQAWNIAFGLAERLLGDVPPRSMSVWPASSRSVFCFPAGKALQPGAVRLPVRSAVGGDAAVVVEEDSSALIKRIVAIPADGADLLCADWPAQAQGLGGQRLIAPVQDFVAAI